MKEELQKSYEVYIAFLEKHLQSSAMYMYVHGVHASEEDVKEGERLRAKINLLKKSDLSTLDTNEV